MFKHSVTLAITMLGLLATAHTQARAPVRDHSSSQRATRSAPIDCGEDMNCFTRAASSCQRARMTRTVSFTLFGVSIASHGFSQIKGGGGNACTVYMRTEKVDIKIDEAWRSR